MLYVARPDNRLEISPTMMREFAQLGGHSELPNHIYVAYTLDSMSLAWTKAALSGHSLIRRRSVVDRGRLFLSGVAPKSVWTATQTPTTLVFTRHRDAAPSKPSPRKAPPSKPSPRKAPPKVRTVMVSTETLQQRLLAGACTDAREHHGARSLLEVAKCLDSFFPGITVADLISAKGGPLPLALLLETSKTSPTLQTRHDQHKRPAAPKPSSAPLPEQSILQKLRGSKEGVRVQDLANTSDQRRECRHVLNRLIADGVATKTGNTRGTRYFAA